MCKNFAVLLVAAVLQFGPAAAEVRLDGRFLAREACPAYQSFRNETNPGAVRTEPDRSYPLVAKNKADATHYLIEIADAQPLRRWVAVRCGEAVEATAGSAAGTATGVGRARPFHLLAVSWQPAFCESDAGRGKIECDTQTAARFDASHFTLHGLWPQPRQNVFCDVPPDLVSMDERRDWARLPSLDLAAETRRELERVMPGTASHLDRHEWIKHGTCFGGETPQAYFARAIALVNELNGSRARDLFAGNVGSEITGAAIREAFDASFGPGAGARVRIECKRDGGRNLIAELTIGLVGEIGPDPSLGALMAASAPTDPGCPAGFVDPVGRQ